MYIKGWTCYSCSICSFLRRTGRPENKCTVTADCCAKVLRHTPSSEVVLLEQSQDQFQNKMAEHSEIFFLKFIFTTVKPALSGHSKNRHNKGLKYRW